MTKITFGKAWQKQEVDRVRELERQRNRQAKDWRRREFFKKLTEDDPLVTPAHISKYIQWEQEHLLAGAKSYVFVNQPLN